MISQNPYTLPLAKELHTSFFLKNVWLVILHASRIPPHVGLLVEGSYNSLTIKGHELNIHLDVLLKTIHQKKIETLFIKLKKHPVFSTEYQKEIAQHYIQQYTQVKPNEASCLSPIKLFLQEFYALPLKQNELLFELVDRLKQNLYINEAVGYHISETDEFSLPMYSNEALQSIIHSERSNYYKD